MNNKECLQNFTIMENKRYPDFAEYFKTLLQQKEPSLSQDEIAKKLGITQGTLSKMKGGMLLPSDDLAARIANTWCITEFKEKVYEARRNDGAKIVSRIERTEDVVRLPTKPRLPVYAAAGRLSVFIEGIMREQCDELPLIRNISEYDFTMFIKGNSMQPKYESGDEIALKKANTIIEWGKDYVLDTEDGAIFKKIYDEGDNIRCVSYNNQEYPDFLVPKSSIYGYYRLIGLIRA